MNPARAVNHAGGAVNGFLLQSGWRTVRGRPLIELWGRLEDGSTFRVEEDRAVPHFWIPADDLDAARALGLRVESDGYRLFDGRIAARVELRLPSEAKRVRERLEEAGIATWEADVRFVRAFLLDLGLRGSLSIEGPWTTGPPGGVDRIYRNPDLTPAGSVDVDLRVLSLDIETGPQAKRLLSIALYGRAPGWNIEEVLLFCPQDLEAPAGTIPFTTERELILAFCERVRAADPDVLTGWSVVDFDLRVLDQMAQNLSVRLELGRTPGAMRLRRKGGPRASLEAHVAGRVVLDGMEMVRGAFVKMDRYSLDAVSKEVLGEGKTELELLPEDGGNRGKAIVRAFLKDRERFVEYNLRDARLVVDILEELRLMPLAIERSRLTGLTIDRVAGSIAAFDFLYLGELHRRGIAAPSLGSLGTLEEGNLGGHVLEPETGLWDNVLVFDFKSLYPSLIRTFRIDPLGYLPGQGHQDVVIAPNGACFRRDPESGPSILPALLDELFPRREAAKAASDEIASHAIKILMNSFYGVMGASGCRFARPEIATAITSFGRDVLLWSKARFEHYGLRVLYGDTDSLFVASGKEDPAEALALGRELAPLLDRDVADWIRETWGVESRLELELERLFRRLMLLPTRRGGGGARKRYAGLVGEGGEAEVMFVGMEVVRRDWTALAKRVQRELYELLFADRDVSDLLERRVKELRAGEHDDELIYLKGLRKPLEAYTATTPPHVAAARKMKNPPRRRVYYVMTKAGPEPASERQAALDHEHYVQKQIRPIAEPVLDVLGLDFDKVIGDDAQMELFPVTF